MSVNLDSPVLARRVRRVSMFGKPKGRIVVAYHADGRTGIGPTVARATAGLRPLYTEEQLAAFGRWIAFYVQKPA